MRLLIVLPEQDRATGNWATARRFRHGLKRLGHVVETCATSLDPGTLSGTLRAFSPDLAILLHAYRSGLPWMNSQENIPYLVLLTGTDVNQGLQDATQGPVIRRVLGSAGAILLQNPLLAKDFRDRHPRLSDRLHYLPPGVQLGDVPFDLRGALGIPVKRSLFLCPAGVRPVKNQIELLQLFGDSSPPLPDFHLAFCGPVLDAAYARDFLAALSMRPWASWLGAIPPAAMRAVYGAADVVVNNSLAEGLPNALVEAAALGRPILARRIPGNAAVVEHGHNGLLYSDAAEFARHAARMITDADLRSALSQPSPDRYSVRAESRILEEVCRQVLAAV